MNHDRFLAAIPLLERIQPEDPTNPVIYSKLGTCYQRTERFDKAADIYRKAIERKADTDQTHAEIGNLYVRKGQLKEAVASMEQAAEMNLTNLQNLTNLATTYLHLGRLPETERVLKALLLRTLDTPWRKTFTAFWRYNEVTAMGRALILKKPSNSILI